MHIGSNFINERNLRPESFLHNRTVLDYPTLHPFLIASISGIEYLLGMWNISSFEIATKTLSLQNAMALYIPGRILSVLMGVATVYITYLVGKSLYSKEAGLLSALFLSIVMLHIKDSHWFTLDVPLTFWIMLGFYFTTFILKNENLKYYILAGVVTGLAAGTKYTAFLLFFVIFIAHFIRTKKILDSKIILSFLSMIIVFLLTTPYSILAFNDFKYWMFDFYREFTYKQYGFGGYWPNNETGWVYHIKTSLYYGMGLPLEILSVFGVVYSIYRGIRGNKGDLLLLSWIIIYYLFIGSWTTKFIRYTIPLVPFIVVTTGRMSWDMVKKRRVFYLVIVLILLYSTVYSLFYVNLMSQKDVRTIASEWINNNIKADSSIAALKTWGHWTNPPLNYTRYRIYELPTADDLINFVSYNSSDYLIVSDLNFEYYMRNEEVYAKYSKFFNDLIENKTKYKMIERFEKYPNLFGFELREPLPPRDILEIRPTILIFKEQ